MMQHAIGYLPRSSLVTWLRQDAVIAERPSGVMAAHTERQPPHVHTRHCCSTLAPSMVVVLSSNFGM
jgi:hypothetical protein